MLGDARALAFLDSKVDLNADGRAVARTCEQYDANRRGTFDSGHGTGPFSPDAQTKRQLQSGGTYLALGIQAPKVKGGM